VKSRAKNLGFVLSLVTVRTLVEQVMPAHKQTSTAEKQEVQLLPG